VKFYKPAIVYLRALSQRDPVKTKTGLPLDLANPFPVNNSFFNEQQERPDPHLIFASWPSC
jgi:hypothetical protein